MEGGKEIIITDMFCSKHVIVGKKTTSVNRNNFVQKKEQLQPQQ